MTSSIAYHVGKALVKSAGVPSDLGHYIDAINGKSLTGGLAGDGIGAL
jgi:hypothetical protein